MTEAPQKPLHKPSESHTLDEVLKSLQDLIRNELIEPEAGQRPGVAKGPVAPPRITPTVKPASRWEARGYGKAKQKPDVNVDAVLDSLRDIVNNQLTAHRPRAPADRAPQEDAQPPIEASAVPGASDATAGLSIEWTDALDQAAEALASGIAHATTEAKTTDRIPPAERREVVPELPLVSRTTTREQDATPVPVNKAPSLTATPKASATAGEQQSFLFDGGNTSEQELPALDISLDGSLGADALPTLELDELTHVERPAASPVTPSPVAEPAPPKPSQDAVAAPTAPADEAEPSAVKPPNDFNDVTPQNVGAMPVVEFTPSIVGAQAKKTASETIESASAAPPEDRKQAPSTNARPELKPDTATTLEPALAIPESETEPAKTAATPAIAPAGTTGKGDKNPSAAALAPPDPRKLAVRTIAKLNIELRRCGERTLDPRMVDRLQFVLQELLKNPSSK